MRLKKYIMDALNAQQTKCIFTGFGKLKHIVLFDTLINKMTAKQILTVLAHEIGMLRKHTLKIYFCHLLRFPYTY